MNIGRLKVPPDFRRDEEVYLMGRESAVEPKHKLRLGDGGDDDKDARRGRLRK